MKKYPLRRRKSNTDETNMDVSEIYDDNDISAINERIPAINEMETAEVLLTMQ